jgi:hypothetical protein
MSAHRDRIRSEHVIDADRAKLNDGSGSRGSRDALRSNGFRAALSTSDGQTQHHNDGFGVNLSISYKSDTNVREGSSSLPSAESRSVSHPKSAEIHSFGRQSGVMSEGPDAPYAGQILPGWCGARVAHFEHLYIAHSEGRGYRCAGRAAPRTSDQHAYAARPAPRWRPFVLDAPLSFD